MRLDNVPVRIGRLRDGVYCQRLHDSREDGGLSKEDTGAFPIMALVRGEHRLRHDDPMPDLLPKPKAKSRGSRSAGLPGVAINRSGLKVIGSS